MKNIFEPKLRIASGLVAPDSFYCEGDLIPNNTFIVSRDRLGNAKSRYGDLTWDFSAYHPEGRSDILNFIFWGKAQPSASHLQLSASMMRIIFCLIWRRQGAPLSIGTLRNYLTVLSTVASYAHEHGVTLGAIFEEEKRLKDFWVTRCSGWMAETLGSLLSLLADLGPDAVGFEVVSAQYIEELKKQNKDYRNGLKQHPPMPTRIYSNFIAGITDELTKWKTVSTEVNHAARCCAVDPRVGRVVETQRAYSTENFIAHIDFVVFKDMISSETTRYFQENNFSVDVAGLSSLLTQVQYNAKLLIQTFSGMRDDEVNSLPFHCLSTSESNGVKHFLIQGRTTKLAHGLVQRTQWVTNQQGHEAIRIAQEIASVIYRTCGATPEQDPKRINKCPLFVSLRYLGLKTMKILPVDGHFLPGDMSYRELPMSCISTIEESDLQELEHIDPHRAWRSEAKFKLGTEWSFTSHQTRRSLALYAQRSGLVSLPSLRRQLKHLTDGMARYYAKGSAFARNFIGNDKKHFGLDWQNSQAESSALSYILNVLMSGDQLFGAHAQWIEQRMKKPEGQVLSSREVTMKQFKKGELAYKETILGGCTSQGPCDQVAVQLLRTACVSNNCKNLVGKLSKLELVIKAQEKFIGNLDHNSVEFRTEARELTCLMEARDRAKTAKEILS